MQRVASVVKGRWQQCEGWAWLGWVRLAWLAWLGCLCRDGHLGHGPWAMGHGPRGEIEGGVDGQWMGSGREVESEWWSGMAVVHVSRLYAKGSSHFDPPPRNETAEHPCSRAAAAAASRTREPAPGHGGLEHQTSISAIQISRSGRLQCRPLIGMGADKNVYHTVV